VSSDGPVDDPDGVTGTPGQPDESDAADPGRMEPADPFAELSLDESFVQGATIHEPPAHERAHPAGSAPPSPSAAPSSGAGRRPPPYDDDLTRRLARDGWDDEVDADDEPLRRRHSPVVRAVAVVMVIAIVVTYLGVHLLAILG
jgi:hypothetical protein